jgi:Helix-turn-helix domain
MTAVWETNIGPATKRLVLLALADSANDEGVCWPSVATIARKAGASRRRTEEVLSELAVDGLLDKTPRMNSSNLYQLNASALMEAREIRAPREEGGVPPAKSAGAPAKSAGPPRENPQPNRKRTPKESEQEPNTPAAGAASVSYSEAFEAAWIAYGRKGAKRAAWLEWERSIKRATPEVIASAIPAYLASLSAPKYAKDFERYLKYDVWESAPCVAEQSGADHEAWLREAWNRGDFASIESRTGLQFPRTPPHLLPSDPAERAAYMLRDVRQWIADKHVRILELLVNPSAPSKGIQN